MIQILLRVPYSRLQLHRPHALDFLLVINQATEFTYRVQINNCLIVLYISQSIGLPGEGFFSVW